MNLRQRSASLPLLADAPDAIAKSSAARSKPAVSRWTVASSARPRPTTSTRAPPLTSYETRHRASAGARPNVLATDLLEPELRGVFLPQGDELDGHGVVVAVRCRDAHGAAASRPSA